MSASQVSVEGRGGIVFETSLQRADPRRPLFRQIVEAIRQALGGDLDDGVRLPTERALAQTFAVSRITVRRAMMELDAAGLIRRRVGSGTYYVRAR